MHLLSAEQVRLQLRRNQVENVGAQLERGFAAFYLGNVAPDYQTICNIPRAKTHFYDLPPESDEQPQKLFLNRYPELADAAELDGDQACFLAGYCVHLLLDYAWYSEILMPFFINSDGWRDYRQRFVAHDALLTYLDGIAVGALPDDAGKVLATATPSQWLPFATDDDLIRWQQTLVDQLRPGHRVQTAAIYARRLSIATRDFEAKVTSKEWLKEHLFARVPVEQVQKRLDAAISRGAVLTNSYLEGS